jgi:hypothetical protein
MQSTSLARFVVAGVRYAMGLNATQGRLQGSPLEMIERVHTRFFVRKFFTNARAGAKEENPAS